MGSTQPFYYFNLAETMNSLASEALMGLSSTHAHIAMSGADGTGGSDAMSEFIEQPANEAGQEESGTGGGGDLGGGGEMHDDLPAETNPGSGDDGLGSGEGFGGGGGGAR